jgi:hypothetical protein
MNLVNPGASVAPGLTAAISPPSKELQTPFDPVLIKLIQA